MYSCRAYFLILVGDYQNTPKRLNSLEGRHEMALFDTHAAPVGGRSAWGRMTASMTNLVGEAIAWNDARQTRKALGSLTDRELDDIGLVRGDIDDLSSHR